MFITLCFAFLGAFIALKRKVPAGALVGAMLATILFNILFQSAYMPKWLKFYTQVATGAYVGARITREDACALRHILKPALILSCMMLCFTVGTGVVICQVSELTVATALFAMAPAGIADMTLASMDFDAQPSVVALIQTLRLIFIVCLLPFLIRRVSEKGGGERTVRRNERKTARTRNWSDLLLTLVLALACGGLGKWLGVPGGAIAFSMMGCALCNIRFERGFMPLRLRQFVQVFAGALIGCTVGREEFIQMFRLFPVVVLAIVSFLVLDFAAAWAINRWTDMDLISALFSSAPGGLTDMTLIAEDMGADSVTVAGMHMIRLVSVIALYPTIISILVPLLT